MPAGTKVFRFDAPMGGVGKSKKMRGGALRVDGHFTKPGVFPYTDESGKTVMEYRPSSEVFAPASVESWKGVPITDGHPSDLVTDATWADHAIGQLGDDVRVDGDKLLASHVFQRRDAVKAVENRARGELSGGYWIDLDEVPGETKGDPHVPDGIRYDRVHRNIEGNHVASLARGDARLGRDMALRLDAKGHQITKPARAFRTDAKESTAMEIRFDGKTYDLDSEADRKALVRDIAAFETAQKARTDSVATLTTERDTLRGERDSLRAELAKVPEKVAAGVTARVALETEARTVLGAEARFDGKDADLAKQVRAGMEAAIKAVDPQAALDGVSEDYVRGRYASLRRDEARAAESHDGVRLAAVVAQSQAPYDAGAILRAAEAKQREDAAAASRPRS